MNNPTWSNQDIDLGLPFEIRDHFLKNDLVDNDISTHDWCPLCGTYWYAHSDDTCVTERLPYALFNVGLVYVPITITSQPHEVLVWYVRYQIYSRYGTVIGDCQMDGECAGATKGDVLSCATDVLDGLNAELLEMRIAGDTYIFWDNTLEYDSKW